MSEGFELKSWHFDTLDEAITKAKDLTPNKKILYRIPATDCVGDYDTCTQGFIYDENPWEDANGEYIGNYWHIEEGSYTRNGETFSRYFHLTIENDSWATDNDSERELHRLEGYLLDWVSDEIGVERDQIEIIDPPSLDDLSKEWKAWVSAQGLPEGLDAESMQYEKLTNDQRIFVMDFSLRWETAQEREG